MLTPEQTAKLERIKLYSTRYEVVMSNSAGLKYRVGYTARKTMRGMFDVIRSNRMAIVQVSGTESSNMIKKAVMTGCWRIEFSGRTQRDSILEGELQWVGNVANPVAVES